MVTEELANDVMEHAKWLNLPVIFIGDPFQLPPVEPGRPPDKAPYSVLKLNTPNRADLTQVLRQAEDNPIVVASMRIRAGEASAALRAFQRVPVGGLASSCAETYRAGGAVIVHKNETRAALNRRFPRRPAGSSPQAYHTWQHVHATGERS